MLGQLSWRSSRETPTHHRAQQYTGTHGVSAIPALAQVAQQAKDNTVERAHTLTRSSRPGSASDAAEPGRRLWASCG
jgi:hypothetical protein